MAMSVKHLERLMEEWLRPLIEARQWDYCVVWKLGHDPSRFIEKVGCCCSGGYANVKEEEGAQLCRDGYIEHGIKTMACEVLAQLPDSMPLYSGVHTEVVISDQPKWICNALDSDHSDSQVGNSDSNGTRVLIPLLLTGLIELFTTKIIPENQKMLDFLMESFNVALRKEVMTTHSYANVNLPNKLSPGPHLTSRIQFACPSWEGSSSGSNPSTEHPPFNFSPTQVRPDGYVKPSEQSPLFRKPKCRDSLLKQQAMEKDNARGVRRTGSEHFISKNLNAERKRRSRIKEGEYALRALVPKITKMDRASIPTDAIDYIKELQQKVKELQDELRQMEEQDSAEKEVDLGVSALDKNNGGNSFLTCTDQKQISSIAPKIPTEVHLEVYQLSKKECLIKLLCEHCRGGFTRLMETMDCLGLEVMDANVTTFDRSTLVILRIEANEDIQAKKLRDLLIHLARETN
ncbi:transcription factor ABORTED MICROSPORES [Argentina anserina]|uniref:transcription factor ABORTED MICROSPORES n=1 Tax=Argentina anserina TaxID=57926 RepID=UPI0021763599|nr:transcription factor ABORTED MICROSPORES [Potentilla anserina]